MHLRFLHLAAFLFLAAALTRCDGERAECNFGQSTKRDSYCEGRTLVTCNGILHDSWVERASCRVSCHEDNDKEAFCVESLRRDCVTDSGVELESMCTDRGPVGCVDGYRLEYARYGSSDGLFPCEHTCVEINTADGWEAVCSGVPCAENGECTGGDTCRWESAVERDECQPPATHGIRCEEEEDCAEDLVCDAARYREWDQCLGPLGSACEENDECTKSLSCRGEPLSAPTCQPLGAMDEPCDQGGDCVRELVCRPDASGSGSRCTVRGTDGQPCRYHYHCVAPLVCGVDWSTGEALCGDPLTVGGICRDDEVCAEGLICRYGACREPGKEGEPCSSGFDCASGFVCGYDPVDARTECERRE
jgi:hypothetical protein